MYYGTFMKCHKNNPAATVVNNCNHLLVIKLNTKLTSLHMHMDAIIIKLYFYCKNYHSS